MSSANAWNGIAGSTWSIAGRVWGFNGPPSAGGWWYRQAVAPLSYGGAPGLTIRSVSGGRNISANVYFNTAFTWNTTGTMNQAKSQADVRTIATHELGH